MGGIKTDLNDVYGYRLWVFRLSALVVLAVLTYGFRLPTGGLLGKSLTGIAVPAAVGGAIVTQTLLIRRFAPDNIEFEISDSKVGPVSDAIVSGILAVVVWAVLAAALLVAGVTLVSVIGFLSYSISDLLFGGGLLSGVTLCLFFDTLNYAEGVTKIQRQVTAPDRTDSSAVNSPAPEAESSRSSQEIATEEAVGTPDQQQKTQEQQDSPVISNDATDESASSEEMVEEASDAATEMGRTPPLRPELCIDTAEKHRIDANRKLIEAQHDEASEHVEKGLRACLRAEYPKEGSETIRTDELTDLKGKLTQLAKRIESDAPVSGVVLAQQQADQALQDDHRGRAANALETAERRLDQLESDETAVVESLAARTNELRQRASGQQTDGKDEAEDRTTETRTEPIPKQQQESVEDETSEDSERETVKALREDVDTDSEKKHTEQITAAERAVSDGIEARQAEEYAEAVASFQQARDLYTEALEIAENHALPERWETEQRHSMVAEYLQVTRKMLEEQQEEVETDLKDTLDDAVSVLTSVEQYIEVDDHVAAQESLETVRVHLDEAARLLESGNVDPALRRRHESLTDQTEELRTRLPEQSDPDGYRNQDLVESLQVLATKLGESPRPEFVNAYGEYPVDAYLDAFGSWPETLAAANLEPIDEDRRKRRTYSRVEVLDELSRVADDLGRPPSKGDMIEHGEISASPVEDRFKDWQTALTLAGIAEEQSGGDRGSTETGDENEDENENEVGNEESPSDISPPEHVDQEGSGQADIIDFIEKEVNNR